MGQIRFFFSWIFIEVQNGYEHYIDARFSNYTLKYAGRNWRTDSDEYFVVLGFGVYTTQNFKQFHRVTGLLRESGYVEGSDVATRFGEIAGVISSPNSPDLVWVADQSNNCLREIDRKTKTTKELIGNCQLNEVKDGTGVQAKIGTPVNLIYNYKNVLFFDNTMPSIRKLSFLPTQKKWRITTLFHRTKPVSSLALDPPSLNFYMTHDDNTVSVLNVDGTEKTLINSTTRYKDGNLSVSSVSQPGEIIFFDESLFILVDKGNNILRLVNLQEKTIFSVCVPQYGTENIRVLAGSVTICRLRKPQNLVLNKRSQVIYILGEEGYSLLLFRKGNHNEYLSILYLK